jgi:hypothetical protein
MLVTGGFLVAYSLQNLYGGSMKYLDGSEKTLLGINIGVLGFGFGFLLLAILYFKIRNKSENTNDQYNLMK